MQSEWQCILRHIRIEETFKNEQWRKVKCKHCDFACSQVGHLRTHLKTHSGEKPNKCNQCGFASSDASSLRTHLNMLNGEKSNKWKMGIFSHFQVPENGTSSTQIQKRRPLFHANIPPKWWNRYLFHVFTTFWMRNKPILKNCADAADALMLLMLLTLWCCWFLTVSPRFLLFLTVFHHFSLFLTVSHRFSLFLTDSYCFSPFFSISYCFSPFLTVFLRFLLFLTISHRFSQFSHCFSPFLTIGLCVVGPVGLVSLWVWWWPMGLVGLLVWWVLWGVDW